VNFSVEIYLRFNVGPLHALGGFVKNIAEKQHQMGLAMDRTSIAISSFRKKSELNRYIPFNNFE
jgi:hypothetical protein